MDHLGLLVQTQTNRSSRIEKRLISQRSQVFFASSLVENDSCLC